MFRSVHGNKRDDAAVAEQRHRETLWWTKACAFVGLLTGVLIAAPSYLVPPLRDLIFVRGLASIRFVDKSGKPFFGRPLQSAERFAVEGSLREKGCVLAFARDDEGDYQRLEKTQCVAPNVHFRIPASGGPLYVDHSRVEEQIVLLFTREAIMELDCDRISAGLFESIRNSKAVRGKRRETSPTDTAIVDGHYNPWASNVWLDIDLAHIAKGLGTPF